jgi:hypothetical protein
MKQVGNHPSNRFKNNTKKEMSRLQRPKKLNRILKEIIKRKERIDLSYSIVD